MLSEEEKKAIERLEEQLNFWKKQNIKNSDCEIILNLIIKLQKENEEKDKQIDLIIDEFYKKAKISTRCYLQKSVEKCMKYKNCKDCIKQYFAGLVEKE